MEKEIMPRENEINVLLRHLKEDVKRTASEFPMLLESCIVTNGKLIEAYQEELKVLATK